METTREHINLIVDAENVIKQAGGSILEDGIIDISGIPPKDVTDGIHKAIKYLVDSWAYSITTEE